MQGRLAGRACGQGKALPPTRCCQERLRHILSSPSPSPSPSPSHSPSTLVFPCFSLLASNVSLICLILFSLVCSLCPPQRRRRSAPREQLYLLLLGLACTKHSELVSATAGAQSSGLGPRWEVLLGSGAGSVFLPAVFLGSGAGSVFPPLLHARLLSWFEWRVCSLGCRGSLRGYDRAAAGPSRCRREREGGKEPVSKRQGKQPGGGGVCSTCPRVLADLSLTLHLNPKP